MKSSAVIRPVMERAPEHVREHPELYELVPAESWRMARGELRKCRWGRSGCLNPTVVALNRRNAWAGPKTPNWWHYCEDHMFGRVIVNETVCEWRRIRTTG